MTAMRTRSAVERFRFDGRIPLGARDHFERYGFVILPGVLSTAEVEVVRQEATLLEHRTVDGEIPNHMRDMVLPPSIDAHGIPRLHRLPYFTHFCNMTRRIVDCHYFDQIGTDLLGPSAWRLEDTFHGAIWQVKRGGRSSYSSIDWHLDFPETHPLAPVISVGVYLDDSHADNGSLMVVPGSHRYPPTRVEPEPVAITAEAGDVVCHAHNLVHASGPIRDGSERATLYLYYVSGPHPGKWIPFYTNDDVGDVSSLFRGVAI
jgi:hypothetical protein